MSQSLPYTYYSCPCTDITESPHAPSPTLPAADNVPTQTRTDGNENDQTFNPYHPRANFALYPLEHLLFCNECHELRCPRCYYEEVMYYYCPSCLFETQSVSVKGESNR